MAFSLYQSMRTVPAELNEAARIFRLSGWQRFWRLELPFATPGLLWNMMMSMSGGWFFLVAAEAISVAGQDIKLPGIGSYIAVAIEAENGRAIAWAIGAMMAGILLYDQLFFRPLLAWADKFRFEESQGDAAQQSWLLDWTRRSRWMKALSSASGRACGERWLVPRALRRHLDPRPPQGAGSALDPDLGFGAGGRRAAGHL